MVVRESMVGVLACSHHKTAFFDASDPYQISLLNAFASMAALACNNVQLGQRAQALALIEERARLARELHDSVSQALYGLQLGVRTARAHLPANPEKAAMAMDYVLPLSEGALSEMRALIFELRPESLEKEGLAVVLEKMARAIHLRNQIAVDVDAAGYDDARPTPEQKFALQRIAQEALHNMVKHAQCKAARVKLRTETDKVTLEVSDEGRGFNTDASFPGHYGLTGMRERTEALFGSLDIVSVPGKGTRIFARLPIY
jgi:signal transduction histidine kinase